MRVERSTKDQVSSRLALLAKEKEKQKSTLVDEREESFHDIVKAKDEEARQRKEERARQRKERRKMKKALDQQSPAEDVEETNEEEYPEENEEAENNMEEEARNENGENDEKEVEVEVEEINPDLAAMMGFSGFR